ncbi:MAG: hypothetical protein ACYTKD_16970 [Planctomycetota bacterium]|jgi:hypothetical protein
MGHFVKDKEQGDIAENVIMQMLSDEYPDRKFKRMEGKFSDYDIIEDSRRKNKLTVEVKFDIKAASTGNLCFEFTNGKKPTGVCVSKAQEIRYVLKTKRKNHFIVLTFDRAELIQKLLYYAVTKPTKGIRLVYGGDRRAFGLILIPLKTIVEEEFGTLTKLEYKNGSKR